MSGEFASASENESEEGSDDCGPEALPTEDAEDAALPPILDDERAVPRVIANWDTIEKLAAGDDDPLSGVQGVPTASALYREEFAQLSRRFPPGAAPNAQTTAGDSEWTLPHTADVDALLAEEKDFYVIVQAACGKEQIMDTKVMNN